MRETVHHYLLTCPAYMGARRQLQAKLKRDTSSIPFLIGTRIGIPHLLRYIGDTERLRTTFGNVRPEVGFKLKEKEYKKGPQQQRETDDDT